MDDSILDKIFSAAAGVWALVCMAAVALFKAWPAILERLNERKRDLSAEEAGDWERIRADRDYWHDKALEYQRELAQERISKIEYMARAVTAEAHLEGRGRARQEAATIVAIERLSDRNRSGNGGGK